MRSSLYVARRMSHLLRLHEAAWSGAYPRRGGLEEVLRPRKTRSLPSGSWTWMLAGFELE